MDPLLWIGRIVLGLMFVAASGIVFLHTVLQVRRGFAAIMAHSSEADAPAQRPNLRVVKRQQPEIDVPLRRAA